ncbi:MULTISPECIES: hypothetical protein [Sphingomonas]|uniref:Uncharacterized protein n=1 Tax=Sphingomonas trueperi TaxID=53317 RepID=A0A7X5XZX8_9SPHN|nr:MULTISPECIES: hypothetical protein [Sphingomonas]NJB98483.1 hypothetical protein [Sphingomonas trueperi]
MNETQNETGSMSSLHHAPLTNHFRLRAEQERDRAARAPNERHKRLHLELAAIFERRAEGGPV